MHVFRCFQKRLNAFINIYSDVSEKIICIFNTFLCMTQQIGFTQRIEAICWKDSQGLLNPVLFIERIKVVKLCSSQLYRDASLYGSQLDLKVNCFIFVSYDSSLMMRLDIVWEWDRTRRTRKLDQNELKMIIDDDNLLSHNCRQNWAVIICIEQSESS